MDYLTVDGTCENEYGIEKSRFIATVCHIENAEEGMAFVRETRLKFSDATHNCYAFVADSLGNVMKYSDDGEPQGTAGLPILEVIKNKKLYQTAVVVTRYFGGIKLGAGGLVRAYSQATALVLDKAKVVNNVLAKIIKVIVDYATFSIIEKLFINQDVCVIDKQYEDKVSITLAVKRDRAREFETGITESSNGRAVIAEMEEKYYKF